MQVTKSIRNLRKKKFSSFDVATRVYRILDQNTRQRIRRIIPVYVALSLLDLVGVILLATCGTLAFNIISGDQRPSRLQLVLDEYLNMNFSESVLVLVFALLAALFLLSKSFLSAFVNFRMVYWVASQETRFSNSLFSSLLRAPLALTKKLSVGEAQWAIMTGSARIVSGVLTPMIMVLGDIIGILLLFLTLLYSSPIVTITLFLLLVISHKVYSFFFRGKAHSFGLQASEKSSNLNDEILQSFLAVKEIRIFELEEKIEKNFFDNRDLISLIGQKSAFLNTLFRYYLEVVVLSSAFFVVVIELITSDLRRTITSLVLFLSVGLRIIPSLQRLQAITMSLQLSDGMTRTFFSMKETLTNFEDKSAIQKNMSKFAEAEVDLFVNKVEYKVGSELKTFSILKDVSVQFKHGTLTCIMGSSGAGKTTLIDLVAGLIEPSEGEIEFTNKFGKKIPRSRNLIAYCAQNPYIFEDSILYNITLSSKSQSEEVSDLVAKLNIENLLHTDTSNNSKISRSISGGERQRIGIARALFSNRPVLIFDEPTSALDVQNRESLTNLLDSIRSSKTQIVVTHDPSLKNICDQLIVLDGGQILYQGHPSGYEN